MKRFRVLYVIDTLEVGGAERSLIQLATCNDQVDSAFVTLYPGGQLVPELERNGISVYQLGSVERYGFRGLMPKLRDVIRDFRPNIVHSTLFRSDVVSRLLYKKHKGYRLVNSIVNNCYAAQRYQSLAFVGRLKLRAIQAVDCWTAKNSDHFIANSHVVGRATAQQLGIPESKITVIPRGRDIDKFDGVRSAEFRLMCRSNLRCHPDSFLLLNVGRLLDRKGHHDLIGGFAQVANKYPNARLVIAGEGPEKERLNDLIENRGLAGKVELLGNRDDIPDLLAACDAFVFPSHYEGLPGALIEAMLSRCTIVCSDIPENRECIPDELAHWFGVGNLDQLGNCLEVVLQQDRQVAINRGDRVRELALSRFSLQSVVDRYNKLYEKLLEEKSGTGIL